MLADHDLDEVDLYLLTLIDYVTGFGPTVRHARHLLRQRIDEMCAEVDAETEVCMELAVMPDTATKH